MSCDGCKYLYKVQGDSVICRHFELQNGFVKESFCERPNKGCRLKSLPKPKGEVEICRLVEESRWSFSRKGREIGKKWRK